ncbi:MAG TPA: hypothetical protein VJ385_10340 [Fibrobacteria bacterium]|nr:hypothetical protein [Fibrobacteria bacterium]
MRHPTLLLLSLLSALSHAGSLRPGIPRVTWTTDHFTLTIDEKKQDLLPRLGSLAEECYARQKAFFGYAPPGRIQMVFLDEQDYANGSAYSPQKWVVIYLHGAEHLLRGRTRWLPGVLSHEIGHIFTLRKMGEDSRFLGMELYHDWRGAGGSRFHEGLDWTYGRVPPWLAEGLAQYAAGVCGYDTLDTHRQMVLRVAAASGGLMTLAELKGFAWDGRRDEMIYTQGYALVSHLYKTYGPKKTNRYLSLAAARGWRDAFRPAFGKGLAEIYSDWRKALEGRSRPDDAAGNGDYLLPETPGLYSVETSPVPLKEGRFLYLSSRDNDYAKTDLFLADGKGGSGKVFRNATSVQPASGGNSALFTATRFDFLQGDVISELYRYDGESGAIDRLTDGGRVIRGCESQGVVYAVRNHEGRTSVIRIVERAFTTVYTPPDSLEITDIAAGRAPGLLTLGATSGFGGDLYELDLASRELAPLAVSPQDERDPHWAGDTLYFSADYGGVFDVYALAGEQVTRITHVSGGAFHPCPVEDGVWFSSYGWKGFRLARAGPAGEAAPPFTVELPVPAWRIPPPAEYEADTYDHTNLGFLGFDLSLGIVRGPGFSRPADTTATTVSRAVSFDAGSKALTGVGLHWKNPSEVASARVQLGLSKPLDYEGPMHLDRTAFELRVNAFLPTIVVGGAWNTYDYPGFRIDNAEVLYYQAVAFGYAGLDWRLAEHWSVSGRADVENDFDYAGEEEENVYDSDPQIGGTLDLEFADLEFGKDGIVRGFSAFLGGEIPPGIGESRPDFSVNAGASAHASLRRFLFLSGSAYHSEDWGRGAEGWMYGGASAYCAIPLGMQLGSRGGAGIYLDQAYPGIEYLGLARVPIGEKAGNGYQAGYLPGPSGGRRAGPAGSGNGFLPVSGFGGLLGRAASHEIGVFLSLKTLTFFANPESWKAGLRFDAEDFGREPVWSVFLTL